MPTPMEKSLGHVYWRELDGLRALCIIFTIANHTRGKYWFINGTIGVDIFFALSGFLITTLLLREQKKAGQICLSCFYIRRFFRITPLYYLTVALYFPAVWIAWRATNDAKGLENYGAALPWLLTFCSEFRPDDAGATFGHAWTLGIEEKYYIIWPIIFGSVAAIKLRSLRLMMFLPLILLWPYEGMFRGYVALLSGSLLAFEVSNPDSLSRKIVMEASTHVWFGAMVVGYFATLIIHDHHVNLLISIPATAFIAAITLKEKDMYKQVLSTSGLWQIGTLTYSIYLCHRLVGHVVEQVFDKMHVHSPLLEFGFVYLATIAVGYVLHRIVELPFIKLGKTLSDRAKKKQKLARSVKVATSD